MQTLQKDKAVHTLQKDQEVQGPSGDTYSNKHILQNPTNRNLIAIKTQVTQIP